MDEHDEEDRRDELRYGVFGDNDDDDVGEANVGVNIEVALTDNVADAASGVNVDLNGNGVNSSWRPARSFHPSEILAGDDADAAVSFKESPRASGVNGGVAKRVSSTTLTSMPRSASLPPNAAVAVDRRNGSGKGGNNGTSNDSALMNGRENGSGSDTNGCN